MNAFLYFLPTDKKALDAADAAAAGLGYALSGPGIASNALAKGPGDAAGVLLTIQPVGGDAPAPLYDPANQTWQRSGSIWVGVNRAATPSNADLRRGNFIGGPAVRLRDGGDWTIPIARSVVRGATLPRELVLGDDGKTWNFADLPEYLSLCRQAEKAFEVLTNPGTNERGEAVTTIDTDEGMAIAVAALAVNYRVGPAEVSLLRLFSDVEMFQVLRAVCDFDAFVAVYAERQKKSAASVTSSTSAGAPASSPATSPASPT